ncbi:MAG TPA: NUDIX domain-containing protein, partial [Oligoflexia bacterium]|nr:NUDIX domain-containing protein [Oligoflexia bacterium]
MHRKVQCWILSRSGRCLLLLTNKRRGEFWQPVTGTVEDGESFEQAALR